MQNVPLTTFYLVRHGESVSNASNFVGGHADVPLTPQGEEQVRKRAKELKNIHFDAAFSSDLIRAYRTAAVIAAEHKLEVTTNKILRERNYGSLEGKKETQEEQERINNLLASYKKMTFEQRKTYKVVEDMENDDELVSRILTFLRELAVGYPGKTILVGSHGNILRILLPHLGVVDMRTATKILPKNTGYLVLQTDGTDFTIKEIHDIEIVQE
jgi:broad specificity phosphatase PhoE